MDRLVRRDERARLRPAGNHTRAGHARPRARRAGRAARHGARSGGRRRPHRRDRLVLRGRRQGHRGGAGRRADPRLRAGGGRASRRAGREHRGGRLAPRRVGELVFPITQAYVADVVLVDDDAIRGAQRTLWQSVRIAAEPAASVGVAALLSGAYKRAAGERVAVIISGANMDPAQLTDEDLFQEERFRRSPRPHALPRGRARPAPGAASARRGRVPACRGAGRGPSPRRPPRGTGRRTAV